jgi:N-acetylmuramoyl-L-alanine amidase
MQRGVKPVLTRFNDVHLSEDINDDLQKRCNIEHEEHPDLFISIHCNSFSDPSVNGFEIFTTPGETGSDRYATSIFNTVKNTFPALNYRPDLSDGDVDREENFKVLRGTKGPSVLIEAGFLSNQSDFSRLVDRRFRRALAKAICTGFLTAQEA